MEIQEAIKVIRAWPTAFIRKPANCCKPIRFAGIRRRSWR